MPIEQPIGNGRVAFCTPLHIIWQNIGSFVVLYPPFYRARFIYTYIQSTQIIVAQFLHMGELTPQQLTKSQNILTKKFLCAII